MCKGLAERGFRVTVKCAYSYYPEWRDKTGKNGVRIEDSEEDGLRIERHGLYIPSNPNSLLQRLAYEGSFFLSLLRRRPEHGQFDVILTICPLVGSVAYAIAAGALSGAPVWLNVQDLSAQAAVAGGISNRTDRKGNRAGLLERIQNALFRRAHYWSTISLPMAEVLSRIPRAPEHIHLIPNWLHRTLAEAIEAESASQSQQALREGSSAKPVRLLYSGNIGGKQDLLSFCQRLTRSAESFHFRIQGEGARANEVRNWIKETGDTRFEMAPLSDEADLAHQLALADYYVITERKAAGNAFIPSKLIPGIASGTPILAVCDATSPLSAEVKEHRLGLNMTWEEFGNHVASSSLLGLAAEHYEEFVQQCHVRSRFYDRERGIDRCEAMLRHILDRTSPGDVVA